MNRKNWKLIVGVLLIVAVLAMFFVIFLDSNQQAQRQVRDEKRKVDAETMGTRLELYYEEIAVYPETLGELGGDLSDTTIGEIEAYEYRRLQEGQMYELCVQFETKNQECFLSNGNWIPGRGLNNS